MTAAGGLDRAFREACDGGAVLGAETEPLLLDELRGPDGKLPGNVFQLVRQGRARKAGRPEGAKNKRNAKLAQLICQQHGDPVLYMASLYSMPTDQLVELLRLADDSAAMEARLYDLAEKIEGQIAALLAKSTLTKAQGQVLERLVDRLGDIAKVLRTKPGDLAVKALALQKQAAQEVAQYVHGKQPVSVNVTGKSDMVLIVPGINAPLMDPKHLEEEVARRGLGAIDLEAIELVPVDEDEEGE